MGRKRTETVNGMTVPRYGSPLGEIVAWENEHPGWFLRCAENYFIPTKEEKE